MFLFDYKEFLQSNLPVNGPSILNRFLVIRVKESCMNAVKSYKILNFISKLEVVDKPNITLILNQLNGLKIAA